MKKILVFFAFLYACFSLTGCGYNGLVSKREAVEAQWANVENQYQKRADLVPNLVAVVKGYAKHEEDVFSDIAESRARLSGGISIDFDGVDDAKFLEFQKRQAAFGSSLGRLLAVSESYPDLKSNENFLDLQSQLEGIENRISTERKRYNDAVAVYNASIQKFPAVIIARSMGFSKKPYFRSDEKAMNVPEVEF